MNILIQLLWRETLKSCLRGLALWAVADALSDLKDYMQKLARIYTGMKIGFCTYQLSDRYGSIESLPIVEDLDIDDEIIEGGRFKRLFFERLKKRLDAGNTGTKTYRLFRFKDDVSIIDVVCLIKFLNLFKGGKFGFSSDNQLIALAMEDHGLKEGSCVVCCYPFFKDDDVFFDANLLKMTVEEKDDNDGDSGSKKSKKPEKTKKSKKGPVKASFEFVDMSRDEISAGTYILIRDDKVTS